MLPCAHDALSARLIERAGFSAYSIGGFALIGSRYAIPDIGLAAYGEISAGIRDIMAATRLPVPLDYADKIARLSGRIRTSLRLDMDRPLYL